MKSKCFKRASHPTVPFRFAQTDDSKACTSNQLAMKGCWRWWKRTLVRRGCSCGDALWRRVLDSMAHVFLSSHETIRFRASPREEGNSRRNTMKVYEAVNCRSHNETLLGSMIRERHDQMRGSCASPQHVWVMVMLTGVWRRSGKTAQKRYRTHPEAGQPPHDRA
jgi:hypothetical protein